MRKKITKSVTLEPEIIDWIEGIVEKEERSFGSVVNRFLKNQKKLSEEARTLTETTPQYQTNARPFVEAPKRAKRRAKTIGE